MPTKGGKRSLAGGTGREMIPAKTSPRRGSPARPRAGKRTEAADWRESMLARLRTVILKADPDAIEQMKWKKPSNPEGVPVWSHDGMICIANVLKNAVRLTFPYGAQLRDPARFFNTRLDSKTVRAVDFYEGVHINETALTSIVRGAVRLNRSDSDDR